MPSEPDRASVTAPAVTRGSSHRLAHLAADARERSRLGGVFYVAGWLLACAAADRWGALVWGVAAAFLLLALSRIAVGAILSRQPLAYLSQLRATWTVVLMTAGLWGVSCALALRDPGFATSQAILLFCTVAYATAFAHAFAMNRLGGLAGVLLVYVAPTLVLAADPATRTLAIAMGIYLLYLVLALVRSHREYHRRLDLDQELRTQRDAFARQSRVDGLTELANRREFGDTLAKAVKLADRNGDELALLILDLDHFKAVNDRYGHGVGDDCLRAFGGRLRTMFSLPGDAPARLGGEEFAVVLPGHDLAAAQRRAEAFRLELSAHPLALLDANVPMTVSIGAGAFAPDNHFSADDLYRAVDTALYRAKREGRDRVCAVG